jgi:predicted dehydrogenase
VSAQRLALIGAGGIAQTYLRVLATLRPDEARLVAVADAVPELATRAASPFGVPAFSDHLELLDRVDVDAVIVCTPPNTHFDIATDFLAAGISTLCEKPLTIDLASAQSLVRTARESAALLSMAAKFRFVTDVSEARRRLLAGEIGDVVLVENTFAAVVPMDGRWNADRDVSGGGVIIDNGTHSVDLVRWFAGPITEVMAVEGPRVQDLAVEDNAQLLTRSAQGATGRIDLSWSLAIDEPWFFRVHGTAGAIDIGWMESRIRVDDGEWRRFGQGYDKLAAMGDQLRNFVAAADGREPLAVGVDDAIASVEVIEAAYRSLGVQAFVPVSPPPRRVELAS